ncbi:MAG TPA: hypothetical protein VGX28_10115, partial [Frankiaceae bacterium]|nr:hypothetical protein [Frankiaceae bacterium]
TDLRVPGPPRKAPPRVPDVAPPRARPAPLPRVAPRRPAARAVVTTPRLDDSGRAFGTSAPTLPYVRAPRLAAVRPAAPATRALATPFASRDDRRRGWVSVAGGLLLLLVCSHLHRSLRPQPDPRGTT